MCVFNGVYGLDLSRMGYGPVAVCCGRGNKSYDSVRSREFSDQNDCKLFKKEGRKEGRKEEAVYCFHTCFCTVLMLLGLIIVS